MSANEGGSPQGVRNVLWRLAPRELTFLFEEALARGEQPSIEKMVEQAPPEERRSLLYGLLQREIDHRRGSSDAVGIDEYCSRFPDERPMLAALFAGTETVVAQLKACGYELIEELAGGPNGKLCTVRHSSDGSVRAVKLVPAFLIDKQQIEQHERLLDPARLFHTHIVRPLELIETDEYFLLFTESVPGSSFVQLVEQFGPLPVPAACELVRQAALGIAHIHTRFTVHDTINPLNLLLCTEGHDAGVVKLLGLGLDELLDLQLTRYAVNRVGQLDLHLFRAPELWKSPDSTDPRRDVYSLGAVLYFLIGGDLVTAPGRTSHSFETTSLHTLRPDLPAELESVLAQMLAEHPEARFASANDVVAALSPFAQQDSLQVYCSGSMSNRPTGPVVRQRHTAAVSQPPQPHVAPAPATDAARTAVASASPHPKSRSTLKWAAAITTALVLVAVSAFGIARLGIAPTQQATNDPLPSETPDLPESPPATMPAWAVAIVELPGPDGDWWFDEIPWFTPAMRAELFNRIGAGTEISRRVEIEPLAKTLASAADRRAIEELNIVTAQLAPQLAAAESSVTRQLLRINLRQETKQALTEKYRQLIDELDGVETATASHLRALLLKQCSDHEAAIEAFEQALSQYSDGSIQPLRALCNLDYARLLADKRQNYVKAVLKIEDCLALAESTTLRVVASCELGHANRKQGYFPEAEKAINDAELFANDPGGFRLGDKHALRAEIHEARGWTAFDSWKLQDAQTAFDAAKQIRDEHYRNGNDTDLHSLIWIEQGEAMVSHFMGDADKARELYENIVDDRIDANLRSGRMTKQEEDYLKSRRPNLYERFADCYLFGYSIDYERAAGLFAQAVSYADDPAFDMNGLWPHIAALRCKSAMALLLASDSDAAAAEVEALLQDVARRESSEGVTAGQKSKFQRPLRIVEAMLKLRRVSTEERQLALRTLQDEFMESTRSGANRRNLDMLLLVSEELLSSTETDARSIATIVRRLDGALADLGQQYQIAGQAGYLTRYVKAAARAFQSLPDQDAGRGTDVPALLTLLQEAEVQVAAAGGATSGAATRGLTRGRLDYDETGKPVSSRLHTLTIGISEYPNDPSLNLNYPDDDANALFAACQGLCRSDESDDSALFSKGKMLKLTNEQATRSSIFESIGEVVDSASASDLVVVSLSGHGAVDETNEFYFLPSDYEPGKRLNSTGIWHQELKNLLTRRESNVILVLDSCHSGAATTSAGVATRTLQRQELHNALHRFTRANKGLIVLAASLSSEKAFENSDYGHGALTLALLEALRGEYLHQASEQDNRFLPQLPKPMNKSNLITLADVNFYVEQRVMSLTNGDQSSTTGRLGGDLSLRDIPIRLISP